MNNYKLKIAVLSLSALAFFSCKKDEKPAATGDLMTFTGRIGNGGSKTEINGFDMTWSDGDKVRINGKEFSSTLTSDRKTATFTGAMTLADEYEAYYPTSLYDETENKYVLPKTQHYAGDNGKVLSDVSPMYAKSTTTDLTFHNICALIRLDVTGEGTVKAVKVTSATPLSGEFEIKGDASNGFYAQLKFASSKAADTLTLDCGAGVELDGTTAKKFYVAVPKGTYTDLKFTFVGSNGLTWSSAAGSPVLAAGTLYAKELADVKFVKPATLPGEFTINGSGAKVKFSRGNLYYDADDNACHWKFESNQWDFRTYGGNGSCINGAYNATGGTPSGDWGLFGWSTGAENNNWGMHTKTSATSGYTDGSFKDWGGITDLPDNAGGSTWRTLSSDEWTYLIQSRNGASSSAYFGKTCQLVTVGSTKGLLLYPDGYSGTKPDQNATIDVIPEGCVFLPAAGRRLGTSVNDVGSYGNYWSSSPDSTVSAYSLLFYSGYVYPANDNRYRGLGFSVRLVQEVE